MKRLIVTADDYGMSPAVNAAINACIAAGLVTSTNVMTNMAFYKEALKLKETGVSLGIHWTLSCGAPVSCSGDIPSLVTAEGTFYSYPEFRKRYRKGMIDRDQIRKELKAQFDRYVELLGEPDYWNTHQNVHVDFGIYRLFVDTAASLGIPRMRSHQRIYVPESVNADKQPLAWRMIEPVKARLLTAWQSSAHRKGIRSPQGLIVCLNNKDAERLEHLFSHIQWKNRDLGELVIHPATECDSQYFGKIGEKRMTEYQLFTAANTAAIIEASGIQLTGYQSI